MASRLHHVAIACSDIERTSEFFQDVFGLEVVHDGLHERDWPAIFNWADTKSIHAVWLIDPENLDGCRLSLLDARPGAGLEVASGYVLVSYDCDVKRVKERLIAKGYDASDLTDDGGCFRGPDNLRIHVSPRLFAEYP